MAENPFSLHYAVHYGHLETVQLLMKTHDVNTRDHVGRTPLHIAIVLTNDEMFDLLIKNPDVDRDVKDIDGNTPLMEACKTYSTSKTTVYYIIKRCL